MIVIVLNTSKYMNSTTDLSSPCALEEYMFTLESLILFLLTVFTSVYTASSPSTTNTLPFEMVHKRARSAAPPLNQKVTKVRTKSTFFSSPGVRQIIAQGPNQVTV